MNASLRAMLRAIGKYRYLILTAFLLLFGVDMIISGIRILLFELIIFLLGVFVGYQATHEEKLTEKELNHFRDRHLDLNTQLNRGLHERQIEKQ